MSSKHGSLLSDMVSGIGDGSISDGRLCGWDWFLLLLEQELDRTGSVVVVE